MNLRQNYFEVRGFNYQPSYGSSSFENWRNFDSDIVELELRRGKNFFPEMNSIRSWLSWEAFKRQPEKFEKDFEKSLEIAERLDLKVMPVLFNRWHNDFCDNDGIYWDHFMPGTWISYKEDTFAPYLKSIVGSHTNDDRIIAWDLCNEPFSYSKPLKEMEEVARNEHEWLQSLHNFCKEEIKTEIPVGISIHLGHGMEGIEKIEPVTDILMIHPYYTGDQDEEEKKTEFLELLDGYVDFSEKVDKPLLATETCWGSLDDEWRTRNIRFTLSELKKRDIGWMPHALHHSLVADLHRPEFGPVGEPGYLAFIEREGTLREGHDVYNEF